MNTRQAALQRATELHQAGDLARAGKLYADLLERDAGDGEALHFLGVIRWQEGKVEEAEGLILGAIAAGGGTAACFCNLGGVLHRKGDLPGAVAAYQQSLRLDPANPIARSGLVDGYSRQGFALAEAEELDQAEAAFLALLDLAPGHASSRNNLGKIAQRRGDLGGALTHFDGALAASPDYGLGRFNRGICLLGLNRLEEGWADLAASTSVWVRCVDPRGEPA